MQGEEVDIDVSLVLRLLADQFPQWSHLPIRPALPFGTDNALYRLGTEMVLRLPRKKRASQTLEKECQWLPRLAPHLPVAIPIPRAHGLPVEEYPFRWSVYGWLNGENATVDPVDDLNQLATDLAEFLIALQQIDTTGGPGPGPHNFFRGAPLATRDSATRAGISSLGPAIDRDLLTSVWETALQAREWDRPPVWIHGDLDSRNLLIENGRLSAVIDFGGLGVGDPACDVMAAWKLFSSDAREKFRTALAVDESTWMRGRGWVLSQGVVALSHYTLGTNPVLFREAHRWITEVLADPTSISPVNPNDPARA